VGGDLVERVLGGEVAAVEHVQLGVREIAQGRMPSFRGEEEVVRAPQDQGLRLPLAAGTPVHVPRLPNERLRDG
jgi:hypothetical protein